MILPGAAKVRRYAAVARSARCTSGDGFWCRDGGGITLRATPRRRSLVVGDLGTEGRSMLVEVSAPALVSPVVLSITAADGRVVARADLVRKGTGWALAHRPAASRVASFLLEHPVSPSRSQPALVLLRMRSGVPLHLQVSAPSGSGAHLRVKWL